ncbi:MAG: acyl-CoA dehydratase activase-related protein, partial [Caldanaerobacter sp.]
MEKVVGVPKGLLYYDFYPMWKTFFESLGAKVITSGDTNKKIVDDGVKNSVEDACLPVKTFIGHVIDLKRKKLDYIFIPRIVSIEEKKYLCSKFLGLPDFVRSLVGDLPPLIDIEINYYKSEEFTVKEFLKAGQLLGKNSKESLSAYLKAKEEKKRFDELIKKGFKKEALKMWEKGSIRAEKRDFDLRIGVLSHPYN